MPLPEATVERALRAQLYAHEQLLARADAGSMRAMHVFGGLHALHGVAAQLFGKDAPVTVGIGKVRDHAADHVAPGMAGEMAAALNAEVC
jgi:hypothetical protein